MIRLLIVAESAGAGVLTFITEQIRLLGEDFSITFCHGVREETPELLSSVISDRCTLRKVDFSASPRHIIKALAGVLDERYDVVHAHSSIAGFYIRICSLFSSANPRIFYNPHAYAFLRKDYSFFSRALFFLVEFLLARVSSSTTISVAHSENEITRKLLRHSRGFCILNGVNIVEESELAPFDQSKAVLSIGILGRLTTQKSPKFFAEIARSFPECHFVWIGGGDYEFDSEIPGNMRVLGWLPHSQAMRELSKLDIYLQPSKWEGLPLGLLEAMQYRKACVVSNIEAHKECITQGETGYLFGNKEECCKVIHSLLEDSTARMKIGECAREVVKEKFSIERVVDSYAGIYRACLFGRKGNN